MQLQRVAVCVLNLTMTPLVADPAQHDTQREYNPCGRSAINTSHHTV
jgi:hypothetical protein